MFLDFYGLSKQPFGVTPDPEFLYLSATHREALASVAYGVQSGVGFSAIVAKPGMGKTTLLFALLRHFQNSAQSAFLFDTQCNSKEFLQSLLAEFKIQPETGGSDASALASLRQFLLKSARARQRVLVVVDEAQNLEIPVFETLRLLSNFETPHAKLLHIVLAGQPELGRKLALAQLEQLRQRITIISRLDVFSPADIIKYVVHRLKLAGYRGGPLFAPEALGVLVEKSHGVPREINRLCFNAMSLGCAVGKKVISAELLQEAAADLEFSSLLTQEETAPGRPPSETVEALAALFSATMATSTEIKNKVEHIPMEHKPQSAGNPTTGGFESEQGPQTAPQAMLAESNAGEENPAANAAESNMVPAWLELRRSQAAATAASPSLSTRDKVAQKITSLWAKRQSLTVRQSEPAPARQAEPAPVRQFEPIAARQSEPAQATPAQTEPAPVRQFEPIAARQSEPARATPAQAEPAPVRQFEPIAARQSEPAQATPAQTEPAPVRQFVPIAARQAEPAQTEPAPVRQLEPAPARQPRQFGAGRLVWAIGLLVIVAAGFGAIARSANQLSTFDLSRARTLASQFASDTQKLASGLASDAQTSFGQWFTLAKTAAAVEDAKLQSRLSLRNASGLETSPAPSKHKSISTSATTGKATSGTSSTASVKAVPLAPTPDQEPGETQTAEQPAQLPVPTSGEVLAMQATVSSAGSAARSNFTASAVPAGRSAMRPIVSETPNPETVLSAKLIKRVDPIYPDLARSADLSGNVVLNAHIDETGKVREVQAISGDPVLVHAAVEAVRQWEYRPLLVDGHPRPSDERIAINFSHR